MSQRSITSKFGRGSSQKSQRDTETRYFQKVLEDAGISLSHDESAHILTQEQPLVIRDVDKIMISGVPDDNVKLFMAGLASYCKKRVNFRNALMPTSMRKPSTFGQPAEAEMQDSLFRIFLNVDALHKDTTEMILDEITMHADEDDADMAFMTLLLNAIRCLSFIKESKTLTEKLLDTLDIATFALQVEILKSIPEIIPDCQYDDAAKQLGKLLDGNDDLTGAIIDCLNALNLSQDSRTSVQDYIVERLLHGKSLKIFPIIFEFVITDCKSQKFEQTLQKSRDALDAIMKNDASDKETVSRKVILFNKMHSLLSVEKALYDGWIHLFEVMREHKPIDLLLLFVLHSTRKTRKKAVEVLVRKKVKSSGFKIPQLEILFQKYFVPQILHDYLISITEIASNLLRFNETLLHEFAGSIYKLVFSHSHVDHMQRMDIVHSLILLTGSGDNVHVALSILTELSGDPNLQQHTLQLMGLLTELNMFALKDACQLFNLLCGLTCGVNANDAMSGLKDELYMLIRKQLSNSNKFIKQRGIIGAVAMVKCMATTTDDQSELRLDEESLINISNLPKGPPQESAALLELTTTCTSLPDLMGLYYDQLSSVIVREEKLDKYFTTWLCETITQDFQDSFVTETVSDAINDMPLQSLYSLNTMEEVDSNIHVNIGELTMKRRHSKTADILNMAASFRLLRLLHFRLRDGDLASIDALLGCGVIMPDTEDVDDYDTDQMKQVADCIFHCVNWFREIISAFVTQKNKQLRIKVVERLQKLVELEERLNKCMGNIPEHKLPSIDFYSTPQSVSSSSKADGKVTRPRKKFKSEKVVNINETISSTSTSTQSKRKQQQTSKKLAPDSTYIFREIDIDVIILLRYPLKLDDADEMAADQTTQVTTIDIKSFQFILRDFVGKLHALTHKKNLGLSHLNVVDPIDLIMDCRTRLLPSINKHFKVIVRHITRLLEASDGRHDREEMYTAEANHLKTSFGLVLEVLALIFSWTGFQYSKNLNLFRDCLRALRNEDQSQLHSANQLVKEYISKLHDYVDHCLCLQSAVNLVKLMQALHSTNMNPDTKKMIASTSGNLLTKKWYNLQGDVDRGKRALESLETLIKAYLDGANVKTIGGLVAMLQTQAPNLRAKDDYLLMLGSIDKASFHVLYRCLCTSLLDKVKTETDSLTNNEHLVLWRTTALTMQGLKTVVTAQETRTNLIVFLKKCIGILKIFLTHGIPILEIMLRSKTDEVIEILKIIQTSTRFLHHLCCYSKLKKETSLLAYVPQFRYTLETLIFRVKAALAANNCSAAFWMGNLKNRDLQGEDIPSQSTVMSEENVDGDNSEELPPDDSDEEMVEESGDVEDDTASDIFD